MADRLGRAKEKPSSSMGDDSVSGESMLDRLQEKSPYPLLASLGVTERCHLSCPHCYVDCSSPKQELSLGEIETLLDELEGLGVFRLTVTGGDPAVRGDLEEIVKAAWQRHFLITLKTSASNLSGSRVKTLRENGLSKMDVSIYHVNPEDHDRFVGLNGAWKNTVSSLELFSSLGGKVTVNTVVMGWNVDGITDLRRFCEKKGWSYSLDLKLVHKNNKDDVPSNLRVGEEKLVEALGEYGDGIMPGFEPAPDSCLCKGGKNSVHFSSNGDVWICPLLPVSMGNVREKRFKDIWDTSILRKNLGEITWGKSPECAGCEHLRFCSRCPGESYLEHGNMQKVSALDCAVARAKHFAWKNGQGQ